VICSGGCVSRRCRWGAEQSDPAVCRIDVDVVICAVTFRITTAINESAHELAPLHSEIDSSCFSFGTNALSAASSTIRW